jgi:N-acetylneuraminic acid mutarotase
MPIMRRLAGWLGGSLLAAILLAVATGAHAASLGEVWQAAPRLVELPSELPGQHGLLVTSDELRGYFYEQQGSGADWTSSDGFHWNAQKDTLGLGRFFPVSNGFLAYNAGKPQISVSPDGKEWQSFPLSSVPNFRPVSNAIAVFDDKLWLAAGGYSDFEESHEVWSLSPGEEWQRLTTAAPWASRISPELIGFSGKLWLIGGAEGGNIGLDTLYNDVWSTENGVDWQLVTEHAPWTPRFRHSCAVFDGKLWLFGGYDWGELWNPDLRELADVWSTSDGVNWVESLPGEPRMRRSRAALFAFKDRLWIMGGITENEPGNDIWSSADGRHWELGPNVRPWHYRSVMAAVSFNGAMWILGGEDTGGMRNDVWRSADGVNWEQITEHAPWPARRGHVVVVHDGALWLVAGSDREQTFNDVWRSADGATWEQVTAAAAWPARYFGGAVSHAGALWVFGGIQGTAGSNDVWRSADGVEWEQVTAAAEWPGTSSFGFAAHRGEIWIMGGRTFSASGTPAYSPTSAIWHSADGAHWTKVSTNPMAIRENPGMISAGDRLWISGGFHYFDEIEYKQLYHNNVWSSADGLNWVRVTEHAAWSPRRAPGFLAHDDKLWVLGGQNGELVNIRLDDVWFSESSLVPHAADIDGNGLLSLSELLRAIQFYNSLALRCDATSEDGYAPGAGAQDCAPHTSDYNPQDWVMSLSELLRLIQFYNTPNGYAPCEGGEDGFCPVL